MLLYGYFRSTASYRVRIALALKGISYDQAFVHLLREGGQQHAPRYRAINPQGRVPSLQVDDKTILVQSPAILEFLEEMYPNPALLPDDPIARAKIRGIAAIVGCDIHPLNNLAPLSFLRNELKCPEALVQQWISKWIIDGFSAIEEMVDANPYCFGTQPNLADVYLVPQIFSARRYNVALEAFPRIRRIEEAAREHHAFADAHPANQPDAE